MEVVTVQEDEYKDRGPGKRKEGDEEDERGMYDEMGQKNGKR